jgi:hypothetical protein
MAFYLKDKVKWEAAPAAQFHTGVVKRPAASRGLPGKGLVLREHVPDGFGQEAGDVDPGNLGTSLAAEAMLGPFVSIPIVDITSGVSGGFDEHPAQVLGTVLSQRPSDITVTRLTHDRAQPGVSGELLRTGEPSDVADLARDRVGEKRAHAGDSRSSGT